MTNVVFNERLRDGEMEGYSNRTLLRHLSLGDVVSLNSTLFVVIGFKLVGKQRVMIDLLGPNGPRFNNLYDQSQTVERIEVVMNEKLKQMTLQALTEFKQSTICLKRHSRSGAGVKCAFVLDYTGPTRLYLENVWSISSLKGVKVKDYPDLQSVIDDGWVID